MVLLAARAAPALRRPPLTKDYLRGELTAAELFTGAGRPLPRLGVDLASGAQWPSSTPTHGWW